MSQHLRSLHAPREVRQREVRAGLPEGDPRELAAILHAEREGYKKRRRPTAAAMSRGQASLLMYPAERYGGASIRAKDYRKALRGTPRSSMDSSRSFFETLR